MWPWKKNKTPEPTQVTAMGQIKSYSREVMKSVAYFQSLERTQLLPKQGIFFGTSLIKYLTVAQRDEWGVEFIVANGGDRMWVAITEDLWRLFNVFSLQDVKDWMDFYSLFLDAVGRINLLPEGNRLTAPNKQWIFLGRDHNGDLYDYNANNAPIVREWFNRTRIMPGIQRELLSVDSETQNLLQIVMSGSYDFVSGLRERSLLKYGFEEFLNRLDRAISIENERLLNRYPFHSQLAANNWVNQRVYKFPDCPFAQDFDYSTWQRYTVVSVIDPKKALCLVTDTPKYLPNIVLRDTMGRVFHAFSGDYTLASSVEDKTPADVLSESNTDKEQP